MQMGEIHSASSRLLLYLFESELAQAILLPSQKINSPSPHFVLCREDGGNVVSSSRIFLIAALSLDLYAQANVIKKKKCSLTSLVWKEGKGL